MSVKPTEPLKTLTIQGLGMDGKLRGEYQVGVDATTVFGSNAAEMIANGVATIAATKALAQNPPVKH